MLTEKKLLRRNPFNAYRDPETGRWIVVKVDEEERSEPSALPSKPNTATEPAHSLAER